MSQRYPAAGFERSEFDIDPLRGIRFAAWMPGKTQSSAGLDRLDRTPAMSRAIWRSFLDKPPGVASSRKRVADCPTVSASTPIV